MNGKIAPDERIKQESVAERYGVSRSPVREAFRELASDGFIELERDVGARVRPFSRDEMYELYLAREALEPVIIGESCVKITEQDLTRAREVNEQSEACAENGDVAGYLNLDTEMHRILLEASELHFLIEMAAGLWRRTHRYRFAYTSPDRLVTSVLEHRLLLDAIGSGDTMDAMDIYRIHTRRTRWTLARMVLPDS